MTPTELNAALETLGWGRYELARRRGCSEGLVRLWSGGKRPVPPDLAQWLRRAVRWLDRHPVPRRSRSDLPVNGA